jgi:tetratricopeptide (TPR) repeat protein
MIGIATPCFYYLSRGLAYAKAREAGWLQVPVLGALSLYLAFISLITVERAIIWGRPTDLFEETLRYEPNALIAYNMLGHYYFREGEYQKAERNFIEAIRRGTRSSLPYYNLGYLYDDGTAALREKAIFYYKKALEMDSHYKKAKTRLRELNALE